MKGQNDPTKASWNAISEDVNLCYVSPWSSDIYTHCRDNSNCNFFSACQHPPSECVVTGNKDTDIIFQLDSTLNSYPDEIGCFKHVPDGPFWQIVADDQSSIGDDCTITFRDPHFNEEYGCDVTQEFCILKGSITDVTRFSDTGTGPFGKNHKIKSMSCSPTLQSDSNNLNRYL